jgi:hypothetical protein
LDFDRSALAFRMHPSSGPASTSLRVAQRGDLCLFPPEQCGQIVSDEIADLGKLDIRGRTFGQYVGVECVVTLFGKHGRDTLAPDFFYVVMDSELVVLN